MSRFKCEGCGNRIGMCTCRLRPRSRPQRSDAEVLIEKMSLACVGMTPALVVDVVACFASSLCTKYGVSVDEFCAKVASASATPAGQIPS